MLKCKEVKSNSRTLSGFRVDVGNFVGQRPSKIQLKMA